MPSPAPREPGLLPGADPQEDCQTPPYDLQRDGIDGDEDDEQEHAVTWGALETDAERGSGLAAWTRGRRPWALFLERLALRFEKPLNRIIGNSRLNPLYYTGTIAILLLGIVGLTGLYLFFFFQYGFEASYQAVVRMEGQFIARTMRAIHRYASGALVITTLLHAFRILFMERFRGPRWLAWLTGIVMTLVVWLAGVTGYWLIWDERAQLITDAFRRLLGSGTTSAARLTAYLASLEDSAGSWPVLLALLVVHVLLFLLIAFFFWLHVRRLRRPKWWPDTHWVVVVSVVLLVGGLLFPVGMLDQANPALLPSQIEIDPIFLFFLPVVGQDVALWLWGGLLLLILFSSALPWISRGPQPEAMKVNILKERCTGCTKCALDCPYGAIRMVERHDDKPHKFIAIEDPSLCVSCGICVGSCDGVAVTLGNTAPELLWDSVAARLAFAQARAGADQPVKLVFTCERHANHGAARYLEQRAPAINGAVVEVIPLPCVGTTPPDVVARVLDAGATDVVVVGCPPDDCSNREGNLWAEQRLTRRRVPRLRGTYANAPITAAWLAPNEFATALANRPPSVAGGSGERDYLASRRRYRTLTWRNFVPAFLLFAALLLMQIFLTSLPVQTGQARQAWVQVILSDPSAPFGPFEGKWRGEEILVLELTIDDEVAREELFTAEQVLTPQTLLDEPQPILLEHRVQPGTHSVSLAFVLPGDQTRYQLFDETVSLEAGQVLPIREVMPVDGRCRGAVCVQ